MKSQQKACQIECEIKNAREKEKRFQVNNKIRDNRINTNCNLKKAKTVKNLFFVFVFMLLSPPVHYSYTSINIFRGNSIRFSEHKERHTQETD